MSKVLTSTQNMAKEEWLAWRREGIGGSDAAVVCGLSRYKSPVERSVKPVDAYVGICIENESEVDFSIPMTSSF